MSLELLTLLLYVLGNILLLSIMFNYIFRESQKKKKKG